MIDENKIKNAARRYCKATYGTVDDNPFIAESFRKGAKWAINKFLKDLWHDAKEEPYTNLSPILFDGRDREGRQIVKTSFFRSSYWNKTVEYYGIVRWLYLDDLFPKKGGEK